MKIAHITCTFPPYRGGIGNSVYNLAETLADQGHEVTVFTPDFNYDREAGDRSEFEGKFTVIRLKPFFKFGNAAAVPQLYWRLGDFDIVHFHYPFFGAVKPVILKKLFSGRKFKLILHYHMDSRAQGLKGVVFFAYNLVFLPILVRISDAITCASLDYIKHSDLRGYFQVKPQKFKQILFGVNLDQFVTYHDGKKEKRDHGEILFVGGLDKAHYFKGLDVLLRAFSRVKKISGCGDTILNIVGQGGLLDQYKKTAEKLGVNKSVFFHDNIDDSKLVDYYNYSDCLVLPSINKGEAFGLVLLEAMACSTPVITSNLPGVRSVFRNGEQGFLARPGDDEDLAKKIKIILKDRKSARRLGQAGRELVEKKYTWDKVGKRLEAIYHHVKYRPK